ncbi:MAG: hypothetical protein ABIM98_07295 [candidate division WOR-3 bacterium]
MKIISLRSNIPDTLPHDVKVIGYGIELDRSDPDSLSSNYSIDLVLEGVYTETIIKDLPYRILMIEPTYSLDKVPFRFVRPFHLKRGWKLTYKINSQYEHKFLLYCVPEIYPSAKYLFPTRLLHQIIKLDETKTNIVFSVDTKIISLGFGFSYKSGDGGTFYNWFEPDNIKFQMNLMSGQQCLYSFTGSEFVNLLDWYGWITQGGKRTIENKVAGATDYLLIFLEHTPAEYHPHAEEQTFHIILEYVPIAKEEEKKEEKPITFPKTIPKIKLIREEKTGLTR